MTTHLCGYDELSCVDCQTVACPTNQGDLVHELSKLTSQNPGTIRVGSGAVGGQAVNQHTVIDLRQLADILNDGHATINLRAIEIRDNALYPPTAMVGALVTWRQLATAALEKGLVPISAVTGPEITIGGSIAGGSISRFSHAWGSEPEQVQQVDAMLADGTIVRGLRLGHPDPKMDQLFRAIVGGHGWVGIILRAVITLRRIVSATRTNPATHAAVETRVVKHTIAYPADFSWWMNLLSQIETAGRVARSARIALGDAAYRAPIDKVTDVFDGISAVGFFAGQTVHATTFMSRYVELPDAPQPAPSLPIYDGVTALRILGELALSLPLLHTEVQWIFEGLLKAGKYRNKVDPFLFFFEGNTAIRKIVNGAKQNFSNLTAATTEEQSFEKIARDSFARRFVGVNPDLGIPGTLYGHQQTHVLTKDSAVQFLLMLQHRVEKTALKDQPTLFDLLYLPGRQNGPYLAVPGEQDAFAVTVAWQEILAGPTGMDEELSLASELAQYCADLGGTISLVKNISAPKGLVRQMKMNQGSDLTSFFAVKRKYDPSDVLRNEFYDDHLGPT